MTGDKSVVIRLTFKERRHGVHHVGAFYRFLQLLEHLVIGTLGVIRGAQRRADGGKAVAVLGEDGVLCVQLERFYKALPQAHEKVERAAEKDAKDFREKMDLEKAYLQGRFDAVPYINEFENI